MTSVRNIWQKGIIYRNLRIQITVTELIASMVGFLLIKNKGWNTSHKSLLATLDESYIIAQTIRRRFGKKPLPFYWNKSPSGWHPVVSKN